MVLVVVDALGDEVDVAWIDRRHDRRLREDLTLDSLPEERKQLDEGMQAEPAPTLEQAIVETFPDL